MTIFDITRPRMGWALVRHALNPCRLRRASAARVRGTANPARRGFLRSALPLHGEKRGADFGFLLLALLWPGCRPSVEPTAYVGDGMYEGDPPMCFQHREESRPGPWKRSLLVHFNNTCDFALDCLVYNDDADTEQRVVVLGNGRASLLVATGQDTTSFDVDLDCQWHD